MCLSETNFNRDVLKTWFKWTYVKQPRQLYPNMAEVVTIFYSVSIHIFSPLTLLWHSQSYSFLNEHATCFIRQLEVFRIKNGNNIEHWMKNNTKHIHVVYCMQYHFELESAVLFLYAHINCTSYVKVVFKKFGSVLVCGWRAGRVCGLVLVN